MTGQHEKRLLFRTQRLIKSSGHSIFLGQNGTVQIEIFCAKPIFQIFIFVAHLSKVYLNLAHVSGAKFLMISSGLVRGTIVRGPGS